MSKASNMLIEISKCWCSNCEKPFFELINYELEQCPWCNYVFSAEYPHWPKTEETPDKYLLVIDPRNGVPSIMVLGGTEDE
ncbi:hypothetical protein M5W70_18330 [Paenibacillus larvae]|uniref:hypothetical protein n=1 Tax=Paenibacillus larvae TaxID=1464 RepID=UPI00227EBEBE|nr:hypothetical protein [Paenibacillus larvae]MCY9690583.1 hypothetical protein [Paenibacillus larvae]